MGRLETQQIASGLVLGLVVLYDAWRSARHERTVGQRPDLLAEAGGVPRPGRRRGRVGLGWPGWRPLAVVAALAYPPGRAGPPTPSTSPTFKSARPAPAAHG